MEKKGVSSNCRNHMKNDLAGVISLKLYIWLPCTVSTHPIVLCGSNDLK